MRFGVVIPTFNEADFIGDTVASLASQVHTDGRPISPDSLEIVVVDTPGDDNTAGAARAAASRFGGVRLTVLRDDERSMVSARILGMNHLLSREGGPPDCLVSADADTLFPGTWLVSVGDLVTQGYSMVSTSGCFEASFWRRCPTLTRRYAEHVGTVFFTAATAHELVDPSIALPFTPDLFSRFGRPVSDCGFAITPDLYRSLGGFRHEFYDDEREPILAVGWPLMFQADMAGAVIGYLHDPEYETSARRLLHEPEALFSGSSYLGEIENFRSTADDRHGWLERYAEYLDMRPLQRYVVKNYVLQQCITVPARVRRNPQYFGSDIDDVANDIDGWRAVYPRPRTRDIFRFADDLADRYADRVLARVQALREPTLTSGRVVPGDRTGSSGRRAGEPPPPCAAP
ncbi:MAG: glycosyltransferase [Pseudonocardiaceae bacterium]